jgi:hypothetical protein
MKIIIDSKNTGKHIVEQACVEAFREHFGKSIPVIEQPFTKRGEDDDNAILELDNGRTLSVVTQGRTIANFKTYNSWTTNQKYLPLQHPLVEDELPTYDVHWIGTKQYNPWRWDEYKGVLLVDFKRAYRLVQEGKLKYYIPNRKFGEIQLSELRAAGCVLAEVRI